MPLPVERSQGSVSSLVARWQTAANHVEQSVARDKARDEELLNKRRTSSSFGLAKTGSGSGPGHAGVKGNGEGDKGTGGATDWRAGLRGVSGPTGAISSLTQTGDGIVDKRKDEKDGDKSNPAIEEHDEVLRNPVQPDETILADETSSSISHNGGQVQAEPNDEVAADTQDESSKPSGASNVDPPTAAEPSTIPAAVKTNKQSRSSLSRASLTLPTSPDPPAPEPRSSAYSNSDTKQSSIPKATPKKTLPLQAGRANVVSPPPAYRPPSKPHTTPTSTSVRKSGRMSVPPPPSLPLTASPASASNATPTPTTTTERVKVRNKDGTPVKLVPQRTGPSATPTATSRQSHQARPRTSLGNATPSTPRTRTTISATTPLPSAPPRAAGATPTPTKSALQSGSRLLQGTASSRAKAAASNAQLAQSQSLLHGERKGSGSPKRDKVLKAKVRPVHLEGSLPAPRASGSEGDRVIGERQSKGEKKGEGEGEDEKEDEGQRGSDNGNDKDNDQLENDNDDETSRDTNLDTRDVTDELATLDVPPQEQKEAADNHDASTENGHGDGDGKKEQKTTVSIPGDGNLGHQVDIAEKATGTTNEVGKNGNPDKDIVTDNGNDSDPNSNNSTKPDEDAEHDHDNPNVPATIIGRLGLPAVYIPGTPDTHQPPAGNTTVTRQDKVDHDEDTTEALGKAEKFAKEGKEEQEEGEEEEGMNVEKENKKEEGQQCGGSGKWF